MNAPDFLVESIPNVLHGQGMTRAPNPWLAVVFPLILSTIAGVFCYLAAGVSLGLFLGALLLAALITGPLVAAETTWLGRALAVAGIIHGIAGVWMYATIKADLDLGIWTSSYLTLITLVFAIAGLTAFARHVGLGRVGAGAIVSLLSIAVKRRSPGSSPPIRSSRSTACSANASATGRNKASPTTSPISATTSPTASRKTS
jgi:hypothetical protein